MGMDEWGIRLTTNDCCGNRGTVYVGIRLENGSHTM